MGSKVCRSCPFSFKEVQKHKAEETARKASMNRNGSRLCILSWSISRSLASPAVGVPFCCIVLIGFGTQG